MAEADNNSLSRIFKQVTGQIWAHNCLLKSSGIVTSIIIPIIISMLISYRNDWFGSNPGMFWLIMAFFIFMQVILAVFITGSLRSTYDIYFEAKNISDNSEILSSKLHDLEDDLKTQFFLALYSKSWIKQIPIFAKKIQKDTKALSESLDDMLAPITLDDESIFALTNKEHLKFILYLFNDDKNELVPLWKHETTSGKRIKKSPSRSWAPGDGHVGLTYSKKEMICTPDATLESLKSFFSASESKMKSDDEDTYKSFVSVPLDGKTSKPYGVLVATSNKRNRFQINRTAEIIVVAAAAIEAMLIDLDIKEIIMNNELV